jgi:flavin-dependent dehydrogenase
VLEETLRDSRLVRRVVRGARRLDTRIVGNFSFRNSRRCGARFACVGDAACFLDPVFSSGVALALFGAEALVERLLPALEAREEDDPNLLVDASERMDHAYSFWSTLVHAFYHTRIVRNLFFAARPDPVMRAGLISMLAGDLFREDNPFQNMLSASRRRRSPIEPSVAD